MQHKPWALPNARPCATFPDVTQAPQGMRRPSFSGPVLLATAFRTRHTPSFPSDSERGSREGGGVQSEEGCRHCSPGRALRQCSPICLLATFSLFLFFFIVYIFFPHFLKKKQNRASQTLKNKQDHPVRLRGRLIFSQLVVWWLCASVGLSLRCPLSL